MEPLEYQAPNALTASSMKPEFSEINALTVTQQPTPATWRKQVKKGKDYLDYVSGDLVIRLLNKAFRSRWSFEVKETRVVKSQDYDKKDWNTKAVTTIPQGSVVQVLGRLTVPGWGVREQWGAQVLVGGSDVQEHAFKSATTDAMKKCASMFGIALDLYGMQGAAELMIQAEDFLRNDEESFDKLKENILKAQTTKNNRSTEVEPEELSQLAELENAATEEATTPPTEVAETPTAPVQEPAPVPEVKTPAEPPVNPVQWDKEDIIEMKTLMGQLGFTSNADLNGYMQGFMKSDTAEVGKHLTPSNIRDFITYIKANMG